MRAEQLLKKNYFERAGCDNKRPALFVIDKTSYMRITLILQLVVTGCCCFVACKKSDDPVNIPAKALPVMVYDDTSARFFQTPSALLMPYIENIDGLLLATRQDYDLTDTLGDSIHYTRKWDMALFRDSVAHDDSTYWQNTWNVSINNVHVPWGFDRKWPSGLYEYQDINNTWNENGNNQWNISGGNPAGTISQTISGDFPQFTGILPDTIPSTGAISFTFSNANTVNAAVAYSYIFFDNQLLNGFKAGGFFSSGVNVPGTAAININPAYGNPIVNGLYQVRNNYYGGAILIIGLYKYEVHNFNGKRIAFVKQTQIIKNVHVRQ